MQPTTDEPGAGTNSWAGPTYAPPLPATTIKRGRPWVIALVSTLAMLIGILAVGNQWVTDKIVEHIGDNSFGERFIRGITVYSWRFGPRGGHDVDRIWLGSLVLVVVALVLTLLLIAAICRGYGSFGQAFLGAWIVVVVATLLAVYVRAAVIDARAYLGPSQGGSKVDTVFYSPLSPNASQLLAALALGFFVGLVAGVTALLSRRTEVVAPQTPPGYGAPAFGPPPDPYTAAVVPGPIVSPSPWGGTGERQPADAAADRADRPDDDQRTVALPVVDQPDRNTGGSEADPEATTQLPRSDWQRTAPSEHPAEAQPTTELPRSNAPDDDPDHPRHLSE